MGAKPETFDTKYEEYMQNFLCRLLRHDFVVAYINDFFNQNERTYYSFFMLMKVLGAHTNLKFQTNYWSDCYIYFYEKLGIHGILFIPLLLSKGSKEDKKKIIKKYLNEHINNTKEKITENSNLVINLLEFKKVILTYISCVTTRGLENVINALKNDPNEKEFVKKEKNEIETYKLLYCNQLVESFVDVLLRPYSRQNYYVNAGKFIDDNIDFLTNDKEIRVRLREFSLKQKEISDSLRPINHVDILKDTPMDRDKNFGMDGDDESYATNNIVTQTEREEIKKDKKETPAGLEVNTEIEPMNSFENSSKMISSGSNNNINKNSLKDSENNNLNDIRSEEWDVRNENSIRKIDVLVKPDNIKSKNVTENKNNYSLSDFEESFREENVPKKI